MNWILQRLTDNKEAAIEKQASTTFELKKLLNFARYEKGCLSYFGL